MYTWQEISVHTLQCKRTPDSTQGAPYLYICTYLDMTLALRFYGAGSTGGMKDITEYQVPFNREIYLILDSPVLRDFLLSLYTTILVSILPPTVLSGCFARAPA